MYIYIYMYAHTYIHMYIYLYTYICIYILFDSEKSGVSVWFLGMCENAFFWHLVSISLPFTTTAETSKNCRCTSPIP